MIGTRLLEHGSTSSSPTYANVLKGTRIKVSRAKFCLASSTPRNPEVRGPIGMGREGKMYEESLGGAKQGY